MQHCGSGVTDMAAGEGATSTLRLCEHDIVKLVLDFLASRRLHIAQLGVERETGVINAQLSDDGLFLRQLILDGQWDDVLRFVQPLAALEQFDRRRFHFEVLKAKYLELVCIKGEATTATGPALDTAVEQVVGVLNQLEPYCASKQEYSALCLLLTLPRLADHSGYCQWNPAAARMACCDAVLPLVSRFLPLSVEMPDTRSQQHQQARNDRLVQLIVKGVLYESCVQYCHRRATTDTDTAVTDTTAADMQFGSVLDCDELSNGDLSLLSWLQSIPSSTFVCSFEQRNLSVEMQRLSRPRLDAVWTEQMLVTPIKPDTFPYSAMPLCRRRPADVMSRSLNPHLGATSLSGAAQQPATASAANPPSSAAVGDGDMTRSSAASFHLTAGKKAMETSVDRLFDGCVADPPPAAVPMTAGFASDSAGSGGRPSGSPHLATIVEHQHMQPHVRQTSSLSTSGGDDSVESSVGSLSARPAPASVAVSSRAAPHRLYEQYQRECAAAEPVYHSVAEPPALDRPHLHAPSAASYTHSLGAPCGSTVQTTVQSSTGDIVTNGCLVNRTQSARSGQAMASEYLRQSPPAAASVYQPPSSLPAQSANIAGDARLHGAIANQSGEEDGVSGGRSRFIAVSTLEDVQAVRCAEFHPAGNLYAVGSNSKTLRICAYPDVTELRDDHVAQAPSVLYKRTRHHKGSIYCMAWSPAGDLIATGSNDKTIKLMNFNTDNCCVDGGDNDLVMHDGTVRDVCFIEDMSNRSSVLVSGGAGDCRVWLTDCATATAFQSFSGHTGHVLSLYTWGGAVFVSGSQDRSVRFWDLRSRGCVNVVHPPSSGGGVASLAVDPSGRLLVSGHEDAQCALYDIRGGRHVQTLRGHQADVRSVRFSPSAFYLLTAGYDARLRLTDMQGDLTAPLQSVTVGRHADKAISARWHPQHFSFVSTSADKTCTLWALPPV